MSAPDTGVLALALFEHRKIPGPKGEPGTLSRVLLHVHSDYRGLVTQSLAVLDRWGDAGTQKARAEFAAAKIMGWKGRGTKATPALCGPEDFDAALSSLRESFEAALARPEGSTRSPGRVYSALPTIGAWTWHDEQGRSGIELTGEIIARTTLEQGYAKAPSRSQPETIGKNWIRRQLPASRWVVYGLARGTPILWGHEAQQEAQRLGMFDGGPVADDGEEG